VEPTSHGQEISSTIHTRSTGASCESDELKEQNSKDINASLDKSIAKMHELNNMWEKMATNIRKVASEVCEVTKGSGGEAKDTWWWNE